MNAALRYCNQMLIKPIASISWRRSSLVLILNYSNDMKLWISLCSTETLCECSKPSYGFHYVLQRRAVSAANQSILFDVIYILLSASIIIPKECFSLCAQPKRETGKQMNSNKNIPVKNHDKWSCFTLHIKICWFWELLLHYVSPHVVMTTLCSSKNSGLGYT